jgi:hypothetical protein
MKTQITFTLDENTTDQEYQDLLKLANTWFENRLKRMDKIDYTTIDNLQSFIVKNDVKVVYLENQNKRCRLCRWWNKTDVYFDDNTGIGICSNSKIHKYLRAEVQGEHKNLLANAIIKTNDDFGCPAFEQNTNLTPDPDDLKNKMLKELERLKTIQKQYPTDWERRIAEEMAGLKQPAFVTSKKYDYREEYNHE